MRSVDEKKTTGVGFSFLFVRVLQLVKLGRRSDWRAGWKPEVLVVSDRVELSRIAGGVFLHVAVVRTAARKRVCCAARCYAVRGSTADRCHQHARRST